MLIKLATAAFCELLRGGMVFAFSFVCLVASERAAHVYAVVRVVYTGVRDKIVIVIAGGGYCCRLHVCVCSPSSCSRRLPGANPPRPKETGRGGENGASKRPRVGLELIRVLEADPRLLACWLAGVVPVSRAHCRKLLPCPAAELV
ncbi:uncharacterized protein B0I36DRAFT_312617 [Microdochium trichocladiopsis]|uniref:Uncharacterized protein n=1 Tax=Microdochium trichocladiopsis TaxID=1682393 RepID=A0A9P9BX87_9PEZI|nr:uncharacterized protein B0I36DRAFT_312617 [Microdochium trichocladiopsis]KAH7041340.1 hypothetical protein B0I36DRAFT_312617 [Microdochium trichocladiopsis]